MKITAIRTTPLLVPSRTPYPWSWGVKEGSAVLLVEVDTDEGITGTGESTAWLNLEVVEAATRAMAPLFIGQDPHDIEMLVRRTGELPSVPNATTRFTNQVLAGLEMALWDIVGRSAGQPVHRLLGGAVRQEVRYFGFIQGDTADELAEDAGRLAGEGFDVLYMKIGRGEEKDLGNVAAVREAVGDSHRLRLDANEAWDPLTAIRMVRALARFNPEFVEQPTPGHSIEAMAQVKGAVDVPIAADQSVFTPADVYEVCRRRAADVIVLGLHETGGLLALRKAAAVAEAAGVNICVHGVFETGITTCASNQLLATLPNLDDGNQIMCQLLADDIVASPSLDPNDGRLPVIQGPGLGFELDRDAVARAAERHRGRNA